MDILHSVILGIIQRLTEFLPVSSGHLEIVKVLLNDESDWEAKHVNDSSFTWSHVLSTIYIFPTDIKEIFIGLFSGDKRRFHSH